MGLFSSDTYKKAEEMVNASAFTPFAENMYIVSIQDLEVMQVQDTDWSSGAPVRTEDMVDQVQVTFHIEKPIDGDTVQDIDGDTVQFMTTRFWFDPKKTGMSSRGPSRARQFLIAALDIKDADMPESPMERLEMLEKLITEKTLIGKQLKLYITVTERKDGTKRNKIERFVPLSAKKA